MQILHTRESKPRWLWLLLGAAIGTAVLSWLLSGAPPVSTGHQAEGYLANEFSRTSASTAALVERLQAQLRSSPEDWEAFGQLGLAYLQIARETGDPSYLAKAEGVLEKALDLNPEDYTSLSALGSLALARHAFHEALDWGEQARNINPDRAYAYGVMVDAQVELGLYEQAVDTLQQMVDLRPDMSSYSRVSYLRELHGDVEGAVEMMQWAVEGGSPGSENTAWTRTQLGNLYFNSGRVKEAENEYLRTLHDRPDYVYALAGLASVRAAQGQAEEAITLLERAIAIMPLPEFLIHLEDLYRFTGQEEAARRQGELLAAIQQLYRSSGVDLDLEIALYNADHDLNLEETVEQARQAYERRPSVYAADVLAWALYKTGRYREAQTYSQEALRLGSRDALKLFHAGMIHFQLGERAQAREYLEQALAVNPNFSLLYSQAARQTLADLARVDGQD
jgi:tetratricopeptide (TPR) repeat protein